MDSITTLDAEQFKDSVFLHVTVKGATPWTAKVTDADKVQQYLTLQAAEIEAKRAAGETIDRSRIALEAPSGATGKANKTALRMTKRLLYSPQFDALRKHLSEAKYAIVAPPQYGGLANPSGIMDGLFELHKSLVPRVNAHIEEAKRKLTEPWEDSEGMEHAGYLVEFLADYPAAIERARTAPVLDGGLGPLFNLADYPSEAEVRAAFDIDRRWLAFGVPEGLPPELRQQALDELRADLRNAGATIKESLRNGFLELLAHGRDVLTTKPGEKPKAIKESLFGNVLQFCEVFSARNTQNDTELAALVDQCKQTLTGFDPDKARKFESVREEAAARFAELHRAVDGMITQAKARRFDFNAGVAPAPAPEPSAEPTPDLATA